MLKPKQWILEKNLSNEEYQAVRIGSPCFKIEKETEKAYKFVIDTDFGKIHTWCPKTQVIECAEENYDEEESDEEELNAFCKKMESGLAYNQMLVAFAKNNGIKGIRKRMRTETLINKIKEAGLEVPSREC